MLNSVPMQVAKGARNTTLRHPNAYDCDAYRKVIARTAPDSMGGIPTMGGLGVLDTEDESDVDWVTLGDCMMLMVGQYEGSSFNDRESTVDMQYPQMLALIEATAEPEEEGYFVADKHDIIWIIITNSIHIAFEIVDIIGDINIPPYTKKYVIQKRDDLLYVDGFVNLR